MSLIRLQNAQLEFADQVILNNADFSIERKECIGLIGRNGAGKSTLLRILLGQQELDRGEIHFAEHLRISVLAQELPDDDDISVSDFVLQGLGNLQCLIDDYQRLSEAAATSSSLHDMERLQNAIEQGGGWTPQQQVDSVLSEFGLNGKDSLHSLSGGWRRRVALARALVCAPNLLLLDEPTNHLDINTIEWLENKLSGFEGSIVLITHDRSFLQKLASRIVEIDRGRLLSWEADFQQYLRLKEKADEEEDRHNALFDKKLAQEERWIRQGIKARRTRNEGRVRSLQAMREQRKERVNRQGRAQIAAAEGEQSGRKVIEARKLNKSYGDEQVVTDFSLRVMRGDRIGIIGNNGVGKSTLLGLLLGNLQADSGSVKLGSGLQVAYLDQLRKELNGELSVAEFVADGKEFVSVGGRERHVISYLQQFLFAPKRSRTKIRALSGGECNRVLLAKLFTRPCNLLVLDEPSNDLDFEMLEALENRLVEFDGTLLLVSHDRQLLDNVVTSVLVFEQGNQINEYVGGYSDWQARKQRLAVAESSPDTGKAAEQDRAAVAQSHQPAARKNGLSFTEQHELKDLPERIAGLEARVAQVQQETLASEFYKNSPEYIAERLKLLETSQNTLEELTERWYQLEDKNSAQ